MKKRILTAVASLTLALAAILGLGATPALADTTTYTPTGGSTTFVKNLVVDENANIPDITFAYTIQRGTAAAATASTVEILASEVNASIGNAVYSNSDTAEAIPGLPTDADSTHPTAGSKYAQKRVSVNFPDGSFTKPGVYRYVISETNGQLPGVTYDANNMRYLDVFVVADTNNVLSVNSYTLRDSATTINKSGEYTTDPGVKSKGYTNTLTQHDFEFSKAIEGNQGDKNKRFTFTLNISGANPGTYPIIAIDVTGNPSYITVQGDGTAAAEYSLTHSSSIQVLGLNAGATCTVSENAQDYTPTHSIDSETAVSGNTSGPILMNADHAVAFTNTRSGIIPTGVILTAAPFAIGLMLFGALTVLFVSKSMRKHV